MQGSYFRFSPDYFPDLVLDNPIRKIHEDAEIINITRKHIKDSLFYCGCLLQETPRDCQQDAAMLILYSVATGNEKVLTVYLNIIASLITLGDPQCIAMGKWYQAPETEYIPFRTTNAFLQSLYSTPMSVDPPQKVNKGYDMSLMCDAPTGALSVFVCGVCLCVSREPVIFPCGQEHIFCGICVDSMTKCPIDGCALNKKKLIPLRKGLLKRLYNNMTIKCEAGCVDWTGSIEHMKVHIDKGCCCLKKQCTKCKNYYFLQDLPAHDIHCTIRSIYEKLCEKTGG